jgi:hypothetical protein
MVSAYKLICEGQRGRGRAEGRGWCEENPKRVYLKTVRVGFSRNKNSLYFGCPIMLPIQEKKSL